MATINLAASASTLHPANSYHKVPYLVETYVDLAAAATAKGSALAAADVIEALRIPGKSIVTASGAEVVTAATGGTVLTIDVGTGVDADSFVDGFDLHAATAGALTSSVVGGGPLVVGAAGDTVDVTLATATGTYTAGVLRVWALVTDLVAVGKPGIAQLKA